MIKKNIILIIASCIVMLAFAIGYSIGNKAVNKTLMMPKEKTAYELIKEGLRRIGE